MEGELAAVDQDGARMVADKGGRVSFAVDALIEL